MIIIYNNTNYCIDFDAYFSEILEVLEEENQTREDLSEPEREPEEDNNAANDSI